MSVEVAAWISATAGVAALVVTFFNAWKIVRVEEKADTVVKQTNDMKDELVEEVRSSSFARGVKQGKEKGIHRQKR